MLCWNLHQTKKEFANSVDPDEAAHHELPHLDVPCLPVVVESLI